MEVIHPRCCGMDVSKRDAKVCVRIQQGSRASTMVTTWSSLSSAILELADHLLAQRVSLVVMEATGDHWKPFYFLLAEAGLDVMLVNARQARQIPGRKTDVSDAVWLADLAAHGLLHGSFVPPKQIRELKDLVRASTTLVRLRGQEAQRLEKLLESAAIKLSSTISDLVGVTGRRMLHAMIDGEDDATDLAGLAHGNVKASAEELREALTGRFTTCRSCSPLPQACSRPSTPSPSKTPTPKSAPSSTAGTTAANPSSGPRPPTTSSRKPTVKQLQTRGQ